MQAFGLRPDLAVGFMLLAAAPGGPMANLFSHLFKGDLALNITLTAINSVAALVTLPFIANFAIDHFLGGGEVDRRAARQGDPGVRDRPRPGGDRMVVRVDRAARSPPAWTGRSAPRRRRSSAWSSCWRSSRSAPTSLDYFAAVGLISLLFAAISIAVGYVVPARRRRPAPSRRSPAPSRSASTTRPSRCVIAVNVLGSTAMAVPASVYVLAVWPPALRSASSSAASASRRAAPSADPVASPARPTA